MNAPFDPQNDQGVAVERTALAWNRTGLSAAAGGGLAFKVFWGRSAIGLALAALLLAIGAIAYAEGATSYRARLEGTASVSARRLHVLSLAVTGSAVLAFAVGMTSP